MPENTSSAIDVTSEIHLLQIRESIAYELTPRELEVLDLVVEGCTNSQIASTLYISLSTVKTHVRNIYSKLGVNNRIQIAIFVLCNRIM
jgi:DNA-binding NarL/FixJ family response regulator